MPGRLHVIPGLKGKETLMPWYRVGGMVVCLLAAALFLLPAISFGSWSEVQEILTEAYGAQAARECSDFYDALNIPDEKVAAVRDSIARLVEAGYPSGCPKEYLKLAADLSQAGIDLDDLTNKIREGIAKKVSPERLNRVIDDRVKALLEARVLTLELIDKGVHFLDRQMAYRVLADYLLRGVSTADLLTSIQDGKFSKFPALESVLQ
jgi:hypothetical protein